jgi:hypothetical protein
MSALRLVTSSEPQQIRQAWPLDLPLDYCGIAYHLKHGMHLLDNSFWLSDRQKEWAKLPAAFADEIRQTLASLNTERREWAESLIETYANRTERQGKALIVRNVNRPANKHGRSIERDYWQAEIIKNHSVRITGNYGSHVDNPAFDLTFKVGDTAVYDSYNLAYTGQIVQIAEKYIAIKPDHRSKTSRLNLYDFIFYNWDYDAKRIAKRNSEWMD